MGNSTGAWGDYSFALGTANGAYGNNSFAMGNFTAALSLAQVSIGQWTVQNWGDDENWVPTDDLFVVGNGTDGGHMSDALEILKNGDTTIIGALTVSGTTGNPNVISGSTQINGSAQVNGGMMVSGTSVPVVVGSGTVNTVVSTGSSNLLLVPQQGDLLMGIFVNGPQPPTH